MSPTLTAARRPAMAKGTLASDLRGFTLLEVMAALAVISIVMTSIYRLHSQTISMHERARFYVTAPFLAQQKLSEFEMAPPSQLVEEKGDFGEDYDGYTWTVAVEDIESEALGETAERLKKIRISVFSGEEAAAYTLVTCRLVSG